MKAVQIVAPRCVEIVEIEEPLLGEGEVRIATQKACLCGSDIPFFAYDQQRLFNEGKANFADFIDLSKPKLYPLHPGLSLHECVGVVEESKSQKFETGDFVLGLPEKQTGFFEKLTLPYSRVFKLPKDSVSSEEILMSQPLGTVLYAFRKLPDVAGKTVAVVGQGPIGLMFNSVLKLKGAKQVVGLDRIEKRLEVGLQMGADAVINVDSCSPFAKLEELNEGSLADIVIEAAGHAELAISLSIDLAGEDGYVLVFGVCDTEYIDRYPFGKAFYKNLTIANSVGAREESHFLPAAELIASGQVDMKPLITHRYPFDQAQEAYETFVDRLDGAIKVVIDFEE